jgi:hypothetical protein
MFSFTSRGSPLSWISKTWLTSRGWVNHASQFRRLAIGYRTNKYRSASGRKVWHRCLDGGNTIAFSSD